MHGRSARWLLLVVALTCLALFAGLTAVVRGTRGLGLDSSAFELAGDVRASWLDDAARVVTTLGMIVIVGPAVCIGAVVLVRQRERVRATALVLGTALTWVTVLIVKWAVGRARPVAPLVHTSGQSFPSGHAANSVGWVALAVVLLAAIPTARARIAAVAVGLLLAVAVGASRIYLRAHYASDVLAGEAVAIAIYALTAIAAIAWTARHDRGDHGPSASSRPFEQD